jgi:glycosyltransferase 2 family protein
MRMYRRSPASLTAALALSGLIHSLNCITFYSISLALPAYAMVDASAVAVPKPTLAAHAIAVLLALATGALPVGGLEAVFDVVYRGISSPLMPSQQGFMIVLAYRVLQLCVATIGLYYYLAGRREVRELLNQARDANDSLPLQDAASAPL